MNWFLKDGPRGGTSTGQGAEGWRVSSSWAERLWEWESEVRPEVPAQSGRKLDGGKERALAQDVGESGSSVPLIAEEGGGGQGGGRRGGNLRLEAGRPLLDPGLQ